MKLTTLVTGLSSPLDMQIADDGSGRLFVVEQSGRVRIISNGAVLPTSFLDISGKVSPEGGELGLLGVAFHPDFAHNPLFYVNYTQTVADKSRVGHRRIPGERGRCRIWRTLANEFC